MCRRRLGAKRAAKVRRGEDRLTTNNNAVSPQLCLLRIAVARLLYPFLFY
jgi:hypothetical protein